MGNTDGKTTELPTAEITFCQIWKYQCWCVHLFLQWVFELHRWIDSHWILSILTVWQSWEIIIVASSSSATFLSTKIMFGNFSNLHVLIFRISQKDLIWMKVCHGSGSSPHLYIWQCSKLFLFFFYYLNWGTEIKYPDKALGNGKTWNKEAERRHSKAGTFWHFM